MKKELLAVFSGFSEHLFSEEITKRLRAELTVRKMMMTATACREQRTAADYRR